LRSYAAEGRWPFPPSARCLSEREDDRARHRRAICTAPRLAGRLDLSLFRRHLPTRSALAFIVAVSSAASDVSSTHGVRQRCPSIDITLGVHDPGRAVARPSVSRMPSGSHVPSMSFHPTPTVYSSRGFAGLLHPAADHGVRCVSIHACTTRGRTRRSGISPTARALRSFSLASSSDASPRPDALPPLLSKYVLRLSCDIRSLYLDHPTSGPCSTCEAAANAPPLPVECCPLLPWASRSRVCLVRPVTRQSYGLTAVGKPSAGGLLVHPRRTLGQQPPSPMVLIGSAEQSRRAARPERRRSLKLLKRKENSF
jgi:hypothetical protein